MKVQSGSLSLSSTPVAYVNQIVFCGFWNLAQLDLQDMKSYLS